MAAWRKVGAYVVEGKRKDAEKRDISDNISSERSASHGVLAFWLDPNT